MVSLVLPGELCSSWQSCRPCGMHSVARPLPGGLQEGEGALARKVSKPGALGQPNRDGIATQQGPLPEESVRDTETLL